MTERVWLILPPPQEAEQELHEPQPDTMQSTGHGCVLHASEPVKVGHAAPPYAVGVVTERVRM